MTSKVFIIHGWTYNLDKWTQIRPLLERSGLDAVFLKVPGLTEPSDKVWDINGYVDWLGKQLEDEQKPTVIGHSNGGRIALAYVQKNPGKIGKLILIDSAGIPHNHRARAKAKLKILKGVSKAGKVFGKIPPVKKAFYQVIGAQDYLNAPPNMKKTMQNMLDADRSIDLSKIELPVSIIWGREDSITPLSDGQKMHECIKGSDLTVVDEARHAPFFTHPGQTAKIVINKLEDRQ